MNWLDDYLAKNETGYYESEDGSCWVLWGDDGLRLAIGEGEPKYLEEITRDRFIEILIGGDPE